LTLPYCFGKRVYEKIEELHPDVIYGVVPPNFVCKFCALYKDKHDDCKLVLDVYDMWPESLPISAKLKKVFCGPLKIWAHIRDRYISAADGVVYECELFESYLSEKVIAKEKKIYLCKVDCMQPDWKKEIIKDFDTLNVLYLGSVNNIIDVDLIVKFVKTLGESTRTCLHIIGNGERVDYLCNQCDISGIKYVNHGVVYDDEKKWEIVKNCQFGLNIMKKEVFVGATMKSLEYFHWGLALVNNIPADSYNIVKERKCGVNIDWGNYKEVAYDLSHMSKEAIKAMKQNSRGVFEDLFSEKKMESELSDFFDEMGIGREVEGANEAASCVGT
jgi:hypothetical protein